MLKDKAGHEKFFSLDSKCLRCCWVSAQNVWQYFSSSNNKIDNILEDKDEAMTSPECLYIGFTFKFKWLFDILVYCNRLNFVIWKKTLNLLSEK